MGYLAGWKPRHPERQVFPTIMAPAVGFEPTTNGLTVRCATAAPRRISQESAIASANRGVKPPLDSKSGDGKKGRGRNRTGILGFAVRCITTLPRGPDVPSIRQRAAMVKHDLKGESATLSLTREDVRWIR